MAAPAASLLAALGLLAWSQLPARSQGLAFLHGTAGTSRPSGRVRPGGSGPGGLRPASVAATSGAGAAAAAAALAAGASLAGRRARRSWDRRPRPRAAGSGRAAGPVLFGSQGSRSPLVNWYLYELGQDFEMVDAARVDRSSSDFPHPFGQIPAMSDGDVNLFESGAILMYIADKYGGLDTPEKRAEASKWVVWANATLDGICFLEDGNGRVLGTGLRDEPKQINRLDQLLADREFILGDAFSVADVAIGAYLLYVPQFFPDVDVSKWPSVQRYMKQLCERPAYVRAFGEGTAQRLSDLLSGKAQDGKLFGLF